MPQSLIDILWSNTWLRTGNHSIPEIISCCLTLFHISEDTLLMTRINNINDFVKFQIINESLDTCRDVKIHKDATHIKYYSFSHIVYSLFLSSQYFLITPYASSTPSSPARERSIHPFSLSLR